MISTGVESNAYGLSKYHTMCSLSSIVCAIYAAEKISKRQRVSEGHNLLKVEAIGYRNRLNSFHVRELTRGKFIIKSQELSQFEMIGQGVQKTEV